MPGFSRREFLKRVGVTAWAPVFTRFSPGEAVMPQAESLGRAFNLTNVHRTQDDSSEIVGQLAADSTTPILDTFEDWYAVPDGLVRREMLQPIAPYIRPEVIDQLDDGFWAEVVAPLSAVKAWCAGDAPVVARLGFGAVVCVMDRLVTTPTQVWYGLANEPGSELIGWAPALQYSPWKSEVMSVSAVQSISIDTRRSLLTIYEGHRPVMATSIVVPGGLPKRTRLRAIQPGASLEPELRLGLPWLMALETGQRVYGVFWHNRFGRSDGSRNNAIELPVSSARWLYHWLSDSVVEVSL